VVLYEQGSSWIAQALEYDIAVQGRTVNATVKRMLDTIYETYRITVEEFGQPFEGIEPAPKRFHDMFEHAEADFDMDITARARTTSSGPMPHLAARLLEDCAAA